MRFAIMVVFALVLLVCATVTQAQQIDDHIRKQLQTHRLPSLSLVVLKDGKIIKAAGYGLADVKAKTPATPETVYKIGIDDGVTIVVLTNIDDVDMPSVIEGIARLYLPTGSN
ncbi:MAG: serine hydrolase domain-containing protein [Gemmatimonadota bacterium]